MQAPRLRGSSMPSRGENQAAWGWRLELREQPVFVQFASRSGFVHFDNHAPDGGDCRQAYRGHPALAAADARLRVRQAPQTLSAASWKIKGAAPRSCARLRDRRATHERRRQCASSPLTPASRPRFGGAIRSCLPGGLHAHQFHLAPVNIHRRDHHFNAPAEAESFAARLAGQLVRARVEFKPVCTEGADMQQSFDKQAVEQHK